MLKCDNNSAIKKYVVLQKLLDFKNKPKNCSYGIEAFIH